MDARSGRSRLPFTLLVGGVWLAILAPVLSSTFTASRPLLAPPPAPDQGLLRGVVLDAATHRPLPGVHVRVFPTALEDVTGGDGRFAIPVGPGGYSVKLWREGFLSPVYRDATVQAGSESSIEVVAMTPHERTDVPVTVARGGVVTDLTGKVTVLVPPGALNVDASIRVTRHAGVLSLPRPVSPGYLEGSAISLEPPMAFRRPVTVRIETESAVPGDRPVLVSTFDEAEGRWTPIGQAKVVGTRQIQFQVDHFSHYMAGLHWTYNAARPDQWQVRPSQSDCGNCPEVRNVGPVEVGLHNGVTYTQYTVPGVKTFDVQRDIVLGYDSQTADPKPHVAVTVPLPATPPQKVVWSLTVGGLTTSVTYGPSTSMPDSYHAYAWDAADAQGVKLPTRAYQYQSVATITPTTGGNVLARSTDLVVVRNNRQSPMGAGWRIEGIKAITQNPDGTLLLEDGSKGFGLFRPGSVALPLASWWRPEGMRYDGAGNLYVAVPESHRVYKIDQAGNSSVFAGTGQAGYSGDGGPATSATLNLPSDVGLDGTGNLYIADYFNHAIRRVSPSGTITTQLGPPAIFPRGLWVSGSGVLYFSEPDNNIVQKWDPAVGGMPVVVAGSWARGFSGDGGPATQARLDNPAGVAVSSSGEIYIVDAGNDRVRKVDAFGIIDTVAGGGPLYDPPAILDGVGAREVPLQLGSD
jgi:hypothetical protein